MALTKTVAEIVAEDRSGLLSKHASWERVLLGHVADVLNGFPFESAYFNPVSGTPLIRIRDVVSGSTDTFYSGLFDEQFLVNTNELLVGMDGDFNSARWRSAPGLLNQRVCKISPHEENYSGKFLEYVLPGYLAAINAATSSITVKHLSSRTVENIPLPLPPRNEQDRIVQKLDELLSDLDAGVEELHAARTKLTKYRQSLLKAAVEGALTANWRAQRASHSETFETSAQLLERILSDRRTHWEAKQLARYKEQGKAPPKGWQDKYPEPVQPAVAGLPALPDHWLWSSLGQCFHVAVGATPSRKDPSYWNGSIPWVSSGEVSFSRIKATKERISELGLRNSSTEINPIGSVMLGMIGEGKTRGQVAILDIAAANNQNCAAIRVSETDIPPEYVYYWLWSRYEETRRDSSGNNQPALNKSIVERIPIPIAPIKELKAIVSLVDASLYQVELQEAAIATSLKQASAQRKNLLTAAFSGLLLRQDANDEPASRLLQRIRAARATQDKQPKVRKTRATKDIASMVKKLIDVLTEAGDWMPAQEAFRRCGVTDGALTDQVEDLYAELRELDKSKRLAVEAITDAQGRKLYDRVKLLPVA